jgi:hypothetical protein
MQTVEAKVKKQSRIKKQKNDGKEDGKSVVMAIGRKQQHGIGNNNGNAVTATVKVMVAAVITVKAMSEGDG